MSDITVTAAQVAIIFPDQAEVFSYDLTEAMTKGQLAYRTSTGLLGVADANASGKQQCRGLVLNKGNAGQAVELLKRGHVEGFDVSGLSVDAQLFLSDTAGALATTAGTMSVPVGRVDVINTSGTKKKVVYFDVSWLTQWS